VNKEIKLVETSTRVFNIHAPLMSDQHKMKEKYTSNSRHINTSQKLFLPFSQTFIILLKHKKKNI